MTMDDALKAIDKIINNLAESDFVTKHGNAPLETLKEFRQDMANDILSTAAMRQKGQQNGSEKNP